MPTIVIRRTTSSQPDNATYTDRSDYIRGSGASDLLARPLTAIELSAFNFFLANGFAASDIRTAIYLGQINGLPPVDNSLMEGNDRIYGRGGDDYVADLLGDNSVVTKEGNDTILLGDGDDRIFDSGGDNVITDLGGNNTITTRNGSDRITTGDGADNINAFDGFNVVDAGNGDNRVRGGDGYDEIAVGTGDDFVEVRGGTLAEDTNGNGVIDIGEDRNFNGILDAAETVTFGLLNIGQGFAAHNYVFDAGGDDNIRSTAALSRQGDDLVLSDVSILLDDDVSDPTFRLLQFGEGVLGDDTIEVGAGDNLIIDAGGNNVVRTLSGDDLIFTSFFSAGDDEISAGGGADFVNPGGGEDTVRGGSGADIIDLENDGDADTLIYATADLTAGSFDAIRGFDGAGTDKIDLRATDAAGVADLLFLAGGSVLALDTDDSGGYTAGVDLLVLLFEDAPAGGLAVSNFIFEEPGLLA